MKKGKENKRMNLEKIIQVMLTDKRVRLSITKRSFFFFFNFYFAQQITHPVSWFHREMFHLSEDAELQTIVIAGFRGCGKSTIMATAFPLWAILGSHKIKYIVILSKTEQKAQLALQQIKSELEDNDLMRRDCGPFRQEIGPWNTSSLYLDRYKAKITTASTEQSIRGFRHAGHRPQIIILDDPEDLESVKTFEQREKLYNWLLGDVIPAGADKTRLIILGGILSEDSLLNRLKKEITEGSRDGQYCEYPFLDTNGQPLWPERFDSKEKIETAIQRIGDDATVKRELMLNPLSNKYKLVMQEWIHYYDELPEKECVAAITGIDLAISKSEFSDFTAMVSAKVYFIGKDYGDVHIFILPNPVNEKLNFPETLERAKTLSVVLGGGSKTRLVIEEAGYQSALIQQLEHDGFPASGFKPLGSDKRSRIALTTNMIKNGQIHFPIKGAELLIHQLTGFGSEKHDDLADAFAILILYAIRNYHSLPQIMWLS